MEKEEFIKILNTYSMTSIEVMDALKISSQILHNYVKRGYLIPIKKVGHNSIFFTKDVKNLEKIREANIETYQKPKKH